MCLVFCLISALILYLNSIGCREAQTLNFNGSYILSKVLPSSPFFHYVKTRCWTSWNKDIRDEDFLYNAKMKMFVWFVYLNKSANDVNMEQHRRTWAQRWFSDNRIAQQLHLGLLKCTDLSSRTPKVIPATPWVDQRRVPEGSPRHRGGSDISGPPRGY